MGKDIDIKEKLLIWESSVLLGAYLYEKLPQFRDITSFFDRIFFANFNRTIYAPYFYQRWKKECNKYDILEYNIDFISDMKNVLLTKSFENLIIDYFFYRSSPRLLNFRENIETLYGTIYSFQGLSDVVIDAESPIKISVWERRLYYAPNKKKIFKLIDYSDEFEKYDEILYDVNLPFDTVIDLTVSRKPNQPLIWNHNVSRFNVQKWIDDYKKWLTNKKVILRSIDLSKLRNLLHDEDLVKYIEFVKEVFRANDVTINE